MTDFGSLQNALQQARLARLEAEAAGDEVEALIAAVQKFVPGKQRLLFMVECGEPDGLVAAA